MLAANTVLKVSGLSVTYVTADGPVLGCRDIGFEVAAGQCVGMVGESGCGKSTIASAILGLLPSYAETEGEIEITTPEPGADADGGSGLGAGAGAAGGSGAVSRKFSTSQIKGLAAMRGKAVAVVPQGAMSGLHPTYRVKNQVAELVLAHTSASKNDAFTRAEILLEGVGLDRRAGESFPHELSGGMRQRVALAAALAATPALVVADEPTVGLDVVVADQFLELLLERQRSDGFGLLLISHDLRSIAKISDRILAVEHGSITLEGTASEVIEKSSLVTKIEVAKERNSGLEPKESPVVTVSELNKTYRLRRRFKTVEVPALDSVDLEIFGGEIIGLVGPSGSGKSTLARALLGLVKADSGSILIQGHQLVGASRAELRKIRNRLALVHQDPYASIHPHMSIADVVAEPLVIARAQAASIRPKVRSALELVGLDFDDDMLARRPRELSGGQRQRVSIARGIVHDPDLIVLDEPTSMLDASLRAGINNTLIQACEQTQAAMVLITHDLGEAISICDRIVVIDHGKIIETGPTQRIVDSPKHPVTKRLFELAANTQAKDS